MKKRTSYFLFWLVCVVYIAVTSCGDHTQNWKQTFEKFDKDSIYNNSFEDWNLRQEEVKKWSIDYTIDKLDGDTSKFLSFFLSKKNGEVRVYAYWMHFPCGSGDTCYIEMNKRDTLFYYKQNNLKKTFIVGEYTYRFTHLNLDSNEFDYYLLYRDSLSKVRGNNLCKLPTLSDVEKGRLASLLSTNK